MAHIIAEIEVAGLDVLGLVAVEAGPVSAVEASLGAGPAPFQLVAVVDGAHALGLASLGGHIPKIAFIFAAEDALSEGGAHEVLIPVVLVVAGEAGVLLLAVLAALGAPVALDGHVVEEEAVLAEEAHLRDRIPEVVPRALGLAALGVPVPVGLLVLALVHAPPLGRLHRLRKARVALSGVVTLHTVVSTLLALPRVEVQVGSCGTDHPGDAVLLALAPDVEGVRATHLAGVVALHLVVVAVAEAACARLLTVLTPLDAPLALVHGLVQELLLRTAVLVVHALCRSVVPECTLLLANRMAEVIGSVQ
eukprot:CAMPEP_0170547822 /NCGR_PEP_ID=MMETSP0211-20121228/6135_1 /TAXON_ID=311385 /ORGANISM="Pseudokeronopsis sp., Strain OXSARD2" /LENGTH=306 /DNA_ID=CAMNT_0010853007 /DNA_START=1008 /DNA_END=1928 /DNA_ORIENTATION=+